jgi:hypothetical protein
MTPHPDSCPDRPSELATLTQGTAGIPTVIPTKCRDMHAPTTPRPELRHQSRHVVGIIP